MPPGPPKKAAGERATTGHEGELWPMADALRGSMDAPEYKHVVLGLIFLKYIPDPLLDFGPQDWETS